MALSIVGSASAAATSVGIPAHQVGDIIVIFAYRDGSTAVPTKPSASGTVPAWADIETGSGTNSNSSRTAYFVATATNTTTGTWTNATGIAAIVLRGQASSPIGGSARTGGLANGSSTAPAITLSVSDGSSVILHFHGHRTVTAWSTAPTGYTRLTSVATELAVNYKDSTTSDGSIAQSATTTNSGYQGHTVEIIAKVTAANLLADGVVGYWKLDEASGTRADSSPNGNDLTDNNTVASAAGKISNAGDFERSNSEWLSRTDAAQVGLNLADDFSIAGWLNFESTPGTGAMYTFISKDDYASSRAYYFGLFNDAGTPKLRLLLYTSGSNFPTVNWSPATATWYHVAVTRNKATGNVKFYVNGAQQGATQSSITTSLNNSNVPFRVGAVGDTGSAANFFDGLMDEWGVWSRELSADEVAELYDGGSGATYPFSRLISQTFDDAVTLAASAIRSLVRTVSETVTHADSVIRTASRSLAELASLADALARTAARTLAEAPALAAEITRAASRVLSEAVTWLDSTARHSARALADAVASSDAFEYVKLVSATLSDAVTWADQLVRSLVRTLSDTATLGDAISRAASRTYGEAASLADSVLKLPGKVLGEAATLADSLLRSATRQLSEAVAHLDAVQAQRSFTRELADVSALADLASFVFGRVLSEAISVLDALRKVLNGIATFYRSTYERISAFFSGTYSPTAPGYAETHEPEGSGYAETYTPGATAHEEAHLPGSPEYRETYRDE